MSFLKKNVDELFRPKEAFSILQDFNVNLLSGKESVFLKGHSEPPIASALKSEDLGPLNFLIENYKTYSFSINKLYKKCADVVQVEMLKLNTKFTDRQDEQSIYTSTNELINLSLHLSDNYSIIFKSKEARNCLTEAIKQAWNDQRFNMLEFLT